MIQLERRALYNSLRMNWLNNPTASVEPWQVEDYRAQSTDALLKRLNNYDISIDRMGFAALAEDLDSPEELTDAIIPDSEEDPQIQDQVYLLVFELWRRIVPEKQSLSIFCDELDHQIFMYDQGDAAAIEGIQDILASLVTLLDDNTDEGSDPKEVFETICMGCANDIENFLYDFIAEQIDSRNDLYASELLDDFSEYVGQTLWFNFLQLRLHWTTDPESTRIPLVQMVSHAIKEPDLEFNLELLSFLAKAGERELFTKLVATTLTLLEFEEDFQDLLAICADYYHFLDLDHQELAVQEILKVRKLIPLGTPFQPKDPQAVRLLKIVT